jgi:Flp pilus assembly protein TadD
LTKLDVLSFHVFNCSYDTSKVLKEVFEMSSLPAWHPDQWRAYKHKLLLAIVLLLFFPLAGYAQGGSASTGTGGSHVIQGHIYFPSGRRAEGSIQVKLQSYNAGEISAMTDSSGSFTFGSLSPGSYTVVVNAGEDYETAREAVFVDTDVNISNIPAIGTSRRYTVMVTLQLKRDSANHAKASVVNAALAEVPESARTLYEKSLLLSQAGDTLKAIDSLKAAVSLYPEFPLALNELGVQYLKLGQASKAVDPLKAAARLSPDAFTPKLNLGIALLEIQQFREAERQLREAVAQNTSATTAHLYLGVVLTRLRNLPEAEKELRRAIDLGGNQLGLAHYYLGGIYWRKGDYRNAADELEIYLRLSPNARDTEKVRGTIKELRNKS